MTRSITTITSGTVMKIAPTNGGKLKLIGSTETSSIALPASRTNTGIGATSTNATIATNQRNCLTWACVGAALRRPRPGFVGAGLAPPGRPEGRPYEGERRNDCHSEEADFRRRRISPRAGLERGLPAAGFTPPAAFFCSSGPAPMIFIGADLRFFSPYFFRRSPFWVGVRAPLSHPARYENPSGQFAQTERERDLSYRKIRTRARQSCNSTFNSDPCTCIPPLYLMNPILRNLFMKKLMRERVVPTIDASVSWLTFGIVDSAAPSRP